MIRFFLLITAFFYIATGSAQVRNEGNGNLSNILFHIQTEKKATIAFLGGSITNMTGWRDQVCQYLQETFPETRFTFINAGIPSLGSVPHAFRLQQDVLDKGPIDLLFIESAVNDHQNGTPEDQQRKALEGIIRHAYTANPTINMLLMAFAEEDKLADYRAGRIPTEVAVHDELAKYYGLAFINLAEEVYQRISAGEFTWKDDFKDLHPSPFGQKIYANAINTLLEKELKHKTATKQQKARLPPALQPEAYTRGRYVSVSKASIQQGFHIDPSWTPNDKAGTRQGFVNVPVLVAEHEPAALSLSFSGTAAGITVLAGPDAGTIHYSIDGGAEQSIDLYTQWSSGLHLPWYLVLADGLKKGKHQLRISLSAQANAASKGTACRIVYFLVNK